jgi:hypothetical protein
MNVRRGLLRLWLLVSAIWLASWGAYVWFSRIAGAEDTTGEYFLAFHTDFGEGWKELKDFGLGDYLSLAAIGIGIPLAVLIIGWIIAGFRRNSRAMAIWIFGLMASAIIGWFAGNLAVHLADVSPYAGAEGWGALAGMSAFACLRLWLTAPSKNSK